MDCGTTSPFTREQGNTMNNFVVAAACMAFTGLTIAA